MLFRKAIIRAAATVRCTTTVTANVGNSISSRLQTRENPPLQRNQYTRISGCLQADFVVVSAVFSMLNAENVISSA